MTNFFARLTPAVLAVACALGSRCLPAQHMPAGQPMYYPAACPPGGYMPATANVSHHGRPVISRPIIQQQVFSPPHYDNAAPLEQLIITVARNSWFKTEYLNWTITDPGLSIQSAPITDVPQSTVPFSADPLDTDFTDTILPTPVIGQAVMPTLSPLTVNDISGLRGTYGLEIGGGTIEANFWGLDRHSDSFTRDIRPRPRADFQPPNPFMLPLQLHPETLQFIPDLSDATTLTTLPESVGIIADPNVVIATTLNGVPRDRDNFIGFVFDDSYSTRLSSQMWGTELTYISGAVNDHEGFKLRSLIGARFVELDEDFGLRATFNNGGTLTTASLVDVAVDTKNYMYGPEIGCRAEFVHEDFTLSATPRVAFTLNRHRSEAGTTVFDSTTNPFTTTAREFEDSSLDFTPIVQVSLSAEVRLNDVVSLFGSFDAMWIHRVTRPFDNIEYDATNPVFDPQSGAVISSTPNLYMTTNLEEMSVHGVSAGIIVRLP